MMFWERRARDFFPRESYSFSVAILIMLLTLSGCDRLESDWKKAQAQDTLQAYEQFLSQHSESPLAVKARERMTELDWNAVSQKNTIQAYEAFLNQHLESPFTEKAKEHIVELNWNSTVQENTIQAYSEFLGRYSESKFAVQAEDHIGIRSKEQIRAIVSVKELGHSLPNRKFLHVYVTAQVGSYLANIQAKKWAPTSSLIYVLPSPDSLTLFDNPESGELISARSGTVSGGLGPSFWVYIYKREEEWLAVLCGLQGIDVGVGKMKSKILLEWPAIVGPVNYPKKHGSVEFSRMIAIKDEREVIPAWLAYEYIYDPIAQKIRTNTEPLIIDARNGSPLESSDILGEVKKRNLSLFNQ